MHDNHCLTRIQPKNRQVHRVGQAPRLAQCPVGSTYSRRQAELVVAAATLAAAAADGVAAADTMGDVALRVVAERRPGRITPPEAWGSLPPPLAAAAGRSQTGRARRPATAPSAGTRLRRDGQPEAAERAADASDGDLAHTVVVTPADEHRLGPARSELVPRELEVGRKVEAHEHVEARPIWDHPESVNLGLARQVDGVGLRPAQAEAPLGNARSGATGGAAAATGPAAPTRSASSPAMEAIRSCRPIGACPRCGAIAHYSPSFITKLQGDWQCRKVSLPCEILAAIG